MFRMIKVTLEFMGTLHFHLNILLKKSNKINEKNKLKAQWIVIML